MKSTRVISDTNIVLKTEENSRIQNDCYKHMDFNSKEYFQKINQTLKSKIRSSDFADVEVDMDEEVDEDYYFIIHSGSWEPMEINSQVPSYSEIYCQVLFPSNETTGATNENV